MAKRRMVKPGAWILKKPLLKLIMRGGKCDLNLDTLLNKLYFEFLFYIFSGFGYFFFTCNLYVFRFCGTQEVTWRIVFFFWVAGWVVFWG